MFDKPASGVVVSFPFLCLWFRDMLQKCVEKKCAEGVTLLGSPLQAELFACDVRVHSRSLFVVECCEDLYVSLLTALFTQGPTIAAVFYCVTCLLEVDDCDPKCLVPIGGVGAAGMCTSGPSWRTLVWSLLGRLIGGCLSGVEDF